jgi:hypothetical protein
LGRGTSRSSGIELRREPLLVQVALQSLALRGRELGLVGQLWIGVVAADRERRFHPNVPPRAAPGRRGSTEQRGEVAQDARSTVAPRSVATRAARLTSPRLGAGFYFWMPSGRSLVTSRVTGPIGGAVTKRAFTLHGSLREGLIHLDLVRMVLLGRTPTQTKEFEDHVHRHED